MTADRIPVLMYHRVGSASNSWEQKLCISPDNFHAQMRKLAGKGFTTCTTDDFISWMDGKSRLPDKTLLITFDDGYRGVYEYAYPVLQELGWTATVFLVTELIGSRDIWCQHENPSDQCYPLMDLTQIEEMHSNGFSFQSHSRSHADLVRLNKKELDNELHGSRKDMETLMNEPIHFIAYPYGRYNEDVASAARHAGYRAAFSVKPGFNRPGSDLFAIRRLDVYGTDTPTRLLRKTLFGINNGAWYESLKYYTKRLRGKFGNMSILT